jgi:hypothetical protein
MRHASVPGADPQSTAAVSLSSALQCHVAPTARDGCGAPSVDVGSAVHHEAHTGESLLRVYLSRGIAGNGADCEIMIDQSRAIDNRRIKRRLGRPPGRLLSEVKEKLRVRGDL